MDFFRSARAFLIVRALGLLGLCLPGRLLDQLRPNLQNVWIEVCAALLIVGLSEILIRVVEAWTEAQNVRDFRRFFGHRSFERAVAVFPSAKPPIDEHGFCDLRYPYAPPATKDNARAKGIEHVVPFEDLKAVVALSETFQQVGAELHMRLDNKYNLDYQPLPDRTIIGIGLGFNHVTAKLSEAHRELFTLTFDTGTDDFRINGKTHGYPCNGDDCGLVVRIVPRHADGVFHFVCAGRTAAGTEAAGLFLARNWKDLLRLYDDSGQNLDRDSVVAIVSFPERACRGPTDTLVIQSGACQNRPTGGSNIGFANQWRIGRRFAEIVRLTHACDSKRPRHSNSVASHLRASLVAG